MLFVNHNSRFRLVHRKCSYITMCTNQENVQKVARLHRCVRSAKVFWCASCSLSNSSGNQNKILYFPCDADLTCNFECSVNQARGKNLQFLTGRQHTAILDRNYKSHKLARQLVSVLCFSSRVFISSLTFFQLVLSTARVNRYYGRLDIDFFLLPSI